MRNKIDKEGKIDINFFIRNEKVKNCDILI